MGRAARLLLPMTADVARFLLLEAGAEQEPPGDDSADAELQAIIAAGCQASALWPYRGQLLICVCL